MLKQRWHKAGTGAGAAVCGHVWGECGSAEGKKNETDTGEKQEKPEWQGGGEMVETIAENSQFPEPFKDGLHSPFLGF